MRRNIRGSESEQRVLAFIKSYIKEHGYPPSFEDISRGVDLSKSTAHGHVQNLLKRGKLISDDRLGHARAFRVKGMKVVFEED